MSITTGTPHSNITQHNHPNPPSLRLKIRTTRARDGDPIGKGRYNAF